MRLLVCGSRSYSDYRTVDEILDGIHKAHNVSVLIEGGALGADRFARMWARTRNIDVNTFEADWAHHGRSAGMQRNERMLREGKPELVVAFVDKPLHQSKGTANMVNLARRDSVPVSVIEP